MTNEELDAIEKRANAATIDKFPSLSMDTDIPALIAEVRRLQELVPRWRIDEPPKYGERILVVEQGSEDVLLLNLSVVNWLTHDILAWMPVPEFKEGEK